MRRFFSDKRLIVLLVGVIAIVVLIAFSLKGRSEANVAERAVTDVVGFGQSLFSKPAHFVTSVLGDVEGLMNTYEENKRLKARLGEYASNKAELVEVQSENERLRQLVEKQDSLREYDPIPATVISRNPDQWEERIIIDQGEKAGVQKNMAVITAEGLIGKVVLTTGQTATVELLSTENKEFRVSAMIAGKPIFGLIEGYDGERRELIMKRIDSSLDVKEGDQVISSGLGGIFPKGLLIGEVKEVSTDDYGLTKLVYIEPAADFALLDHVVVTNRLMSTVDGTDGTASAHKQEKKEDE